MKSNERTIGLEGTTAEVKGTLVKIKGPKGTSEKHFKEKSIKITSDSKNITIHAGNEKRNCKRVMCTTAAHIKGMVKGVTHGYEYKLKICSSHFPMNVSLNGRELVVKNYLGEKSPRICKIKDNVNIKLEKDIITITGSDKELVGQAAADIEKKVCIRNKDRRIFMDGIYITSKE